MRRLLGILPLLLVLAASGVMANEWPTHRGDAQRHGRSAEALEPPLSLAWVFRTGERVSSSPAVWNNTVYFGSMDGYFYAVDASSGALKWRFAAAADLESGSRGVFSSPCIDNGIVYFATRNGHLFALDAITGALVWDQAYGGQNMSSPVVSNGMVIYGTGYPVKSIVAARVSNGQKAWEVPALQFVHGSPAVDGTRVCIGANDGLYRELDAATGNLVWSFDSGGGVFVSAPSVADGRIYCAPGDYDRRIFALDSDTGTKLWEFTVPQQEWQTWVYVSSPAVSADTVYVVSGYPHQILYALNSTTGAERWQFPVGPFNSEDLFASSPVLAGNTLYQGSWDGTLYALNPADGSRKWSYRLPAGIGSSPAISNGWLYVGCNDGNLYAFTQGAPQIQMVSPINFIHTGWNLVSVPGLPVNPDPAAVFSGIDVANSSLQYWRNEVPGGSYQSYGAIFGWTGPIVVGTPYWLLNAGSPHTLSFPGNLIATDQTVTIPSQPATTHWAMFGTPMGHRVSCSDVRFSLASDPGNRVDWKTAYRNNWVESMAIGFDSSTSGYFTTGLADYLPDRTVLEPWFGYWLLVTTPQAVNIHVPVVPVAP